MTELIRINVGCGQTPTPGWRNFDNSLSVRIARHNSVIWILTRCGLLDERQQEFIAFAKRTEIILADAACHIPIADSSASVLYSCHMIEHLAPDRARSFLGEALRVLAPGGIIRLVTLDLRKLAEEYMMSGDADAFVERTCLFRKRSMTLSDLLALAVVGGRRHLWMYDGSSLCRLLSDVGFRDPRVLPPGSTSIPDPGLLDLRERYEESVYVEAYKA